MQKLVSLHARPRRVFEMDGSIESAAGQDQGLHALGQMHSNVRMLLLEASQARDELSHRERRDSGNVQACAIVRLPHQVLTVPIQAVK